MNEAQNKRREYLKKYYADNREKRNAYQRSWVSKNHEQWSKTQRKARLKRKFGLSTEEYNAVLQKQQNRCGICGVKQGDIKTTFSVDHDHSNGRVRGLLCHECNMGLGKFKDSTKVLLAAVEYLKEDFFDYHI